MFCINISLFSSNSSSCSYLGGKSVSGGLLTVVAEVAGGDGGGIEGVFLEICTLPL